MAQVPADNALPVRATARAAVGRFMGRLPHLPRVALTPFLVLFLVQGVMLAIARTGGGEGSQSPLAAVVVVAAIPVVVFCYAAFLVDWLRLVLLGPDAPGTGPRTGVSRRDGRMLGSGILVGGVAVVASIPGILLGMATGGSAVGGALAGVVTLMLALTAGVSAGLILPPVAVDRKLPVATALAAVGPVLGRVAGIVALTLLPLHLLVSFSGVAYAAMLTGDGPIVPVMVLTLVLEFLELALLGTLLAELYWRRIGDPTQPEAA